MAGPGISPDLSQRSVCRWRSAGKPVTMSARLQEGLRAFARLRWSPYRAQFECDVFPAVRRWANFCCFQTGRVVRCFETLVLTVNIVWFLGRIFFRMFAWRGPGWLSQDFIQ